MRSLYLFCPCHWKWLKPKKKEIDDFNIIEENEIQNNNNISWNALDVTKRHHHCLEQNNNNNNNNLEIKVD